MTTTDPSVGLSSAEVADRVARGLVNAVPAAPTRTVSQIIRANVLTPINLVIAILAALVLVAGSPKNALFAGVIVFNSLIGIVQELRAKRVLDSLSVVSAPKAHVVRDGQVHDIAVHELVLDDVVELRAGAQVVADAVVLTHDTMRLMSLRSGESTRVKRRASSASLAA